MKKRFIWILEFLVWTIIIVFLTVFVNYVQSVNVKEKYTSYTFFQDVDGLIVGSPVRFMGVQVGYVSYINIINDETYINFIVTKKGVRVPQGTTATIQFSGLGGSKSLELYPPTAKTICSGYGIVTKEPIRLQKFMDTQSDIARFWIMVGNGFSNMVTKHNITQIQNMLKSTKNVKKLEKTIEKVDELEQKLINREEELRRRK